MDIAKEYSREDEANVPEFKNWKEAEKYFKNKHGDNFQYQGDHEIDGEAYYFYDLILDRDVYERKQKKIMEAYKNKTLFLQLDEDELRSYQRIEIWENGSVHMLH